MRKCVCLCMRIARASALSVRVCVCVCVCMTCARARVCVVCVCVAVRLLVRVRGGAHLGRVAGAGDASVGHDVPAHAWLGGMDRVRVRISARLGLG